MPEPIDPRFAELMQRYADDALNAQEADELNALLRDEPEMRDAFVGYCLHARLAGETLRRDEAEAAPDLAGRIEPAARPRRLAIPLAVAAAVLIGAATVAIVVTIANDKPEAPRWTGPPVAVLTDSAGVTWADDILNTGDPLPARPIRTHSGRVGIQFDSGAQLATRGPSELMLTSEMRCRLVSGMVAMHVPPSAKGFTVVTDAFEVVDLGTGFGMTTGVDGAGQVHVFEGAVELRLAGGGSIRLEAGQAVRIDATGAIEETEPAIYDYPIVADTPAERWAEMRQRLTLDPGLVSMLSVDDLPDEPIEIADAASADRTVRLLGGTTAPGRFHETTALHLSEPTDGLAIDLPETVDALTFAMWIKLDRMPGEYVSLIQTLGYDADEAHFNLSPDGALTLGISGGGLLRAPGAIRPSHVARWVHLATTYDRATGAMTLYVDGKRIAQHTHTHARPIKLGPCRIACWDASPRVLRGSVADVLIMDRALTAKQVGGIADSNQ